MRKARVFSCFRPIIDPVPVEKSPQSVDKADFSKLAGFVESSASVTFRADHIVAHGGETREQLFSVPTSEVSRVIYISAPPLTLKTKLTSAFRAGVPYGIALGIANVIFFWRDAKDTIAELFFLAILSIPLGILLAFIGHLPKALRMKSTQAAFLFVLWSEKSGTRIFHLHLVKEREQELATFLSELGINVESESSDRIN
jgi:hypothetical protein